ncbi:MAG TPA: cache domain-containing protein, partial [Candidatus Ozemobacteraceae bacterium]|nr:cache domain-containing protein [Candidatus Ozemobacteraceae bacterium]
MFRQIRFQLLTLIVGVVLLAAVFIGGFVLYRIHTNLTEDAITAQRHLSNALKQGLAMKFEEIRLHLQHVAEHPLLLHPDPTRCRSLLSEFLVQNPLFFSALLYDRNGTVLSAIYRNHSPIADRIVGRNLLRAGASYQRLIEAFKTVVATNQPVISDAVSSVRQGPLVVMKFPVRSLDQPNQVTRVLSLGIHLNGAVLQHTLTRYAPPDGFLALIDRKGEIIARAGSGMPTTLSGILLEPWPEESAPQSAWTTLNNRSFLVFAR